MWLVKLSLFNLLHSNVSAEVQKLFFPKISSPPAHLEVSCFLFVCLFCFVLLLIDFQNKMGEFGNEARKKKEQKKQTHTQKKRKGASKMK